MVAAHSNPFNLLVGGITSHKKVTLVNKIIEVKQIIPIKIRQIKQFTALESNHSATLPPQKGNIMTHTCLEFNMCNAFAFLDKNKKCKARNSNKKNGASRAGTVNKNSCLIKFFLSLLADGL